MTYSEFLEAINDAMYQTTGKLMASNDLCAAHFVNMFKKLDVHTAMTIIENAEKFKEFHPDSIKMYKGVIAHGK